MSDNLRDGPPWTPPLPNGANIALDGGGEVAVDPRKQLIDIELPGGSVRINLGGIMPNATPRENSKFDDNLAEDVGESTLGQMASELLRAIARDDESRREWLEQRAKGIGMLGLTVRQPHSTGADASAPVEGQSTYIDPVILEAAVRFQANARSEFLPTDGPVKIRNDQQGDDQSGYDLAQALATDLNHYLTKTDKNYYADTDRMYLPLGVGGSMFKKVYFDPIKRRPVSVTVDPEDLIVSNDATALADAKRVTHRSFVRTSMLKRLQRAGVYRDVNVSEPIAPQTSSVDQAKSTVSGIAPPTSSIAEDQDHEIYECHCEWDLPQGVWKRKRDAGDDQKPLDLDGIALPYRVTIEKTSEQILAIHRNWDRDDVWCLPAPMFVHYIFIPGFGFYGIGLLHLLGNVANGITAATREMLDAGMMACFPGFLFSTSVGRQKTNEFRVPAGGGKGLDTGGKPIQDSVMALPYKEPSAALMSLIDSLRENAQRLGGTAEVQVGEGRQDAPVGTTIALIEQATLPQNAVHKRMFEAQSRELDMLTDLFRADPEAMWRHNKKPTAQWTKDLFLQALDDNDLVPVADPNTSSHIERIGRTQTLLQVAQAAPQGLFNIVPTAEQVVKDMRLGDPKVLINYQWQPPGPDQPPPPDPSKMLDAQARQKIADAKMMEVQGKLKQPAAPPNPSEMVEAQAKKQMADAKMADVQATIANHHTDLQQAQAEMSSKENIEKLRLTAEMARAQQQQANERMIQRDKADDDLRLDQQAHVHSVVADAASQGIGHRHAVHQKVLDHALTPPPPPQGIVPQ